MAPSATCGSRPATATRARSATSSTSARPTTRAACTATPGSPTTATPCSSTAAPTTASRSRASASTRRRTSTTRRMTNYLTPVSDFPDLADALEASCADLTGKQLINLSTGPNDRNTYAQADHRRRTVPRSRRWRRPWSSAPRPVQCDFEPQLDPNTPGRPAAQAPARSRSFSEDFEDGLGDWHRRGGQRLHGGLQPGLEVDDRPAAGNKPAGRPAAAFGPAPDLGSCTGDAGDFSSVNYLTSPDIVVGDDGRPRGSAGCRSTTTSRPSSASTAARCSSQ